PHLHLLSFPTRPLFRSPKNLVGHPNSRCWHAANRVERRRGSVDFPDDAIVPEEAGPPAGTGDLMTGSSKDSQLQTAGLPDSAQRSEEHTSELQSRSDLV